jgi:hypothetical protein
MGQAIADRLALRLSTSSYVAAIAAIVGAVLYSGAVWFAGSAVGLALAAPWLLGIASFMLSVVGKRLRP